MLAIVACLLVAFQAAWLTFGVLDNLLHPAINRDEVRNVLRMVSLADYPEVEARVGHRRILDERAVRLCFAAIVGCELVALILLWAATAALAADALGLVEGTWPRILAMAAVLAFTGIWTAFLAGAQWFYYWFGAHGQQTHFMAAIWGVATLAVLAS